MTSSEFDNSPSGASADNVKAGVFSSNEDLKKVAKRLRRHIVTMIGKAGSGHPGGTPAYNNNIVHVYLAPAISNHKI